MASSDYLRAPLPSTEMPRGIPYIIGNEAAERFSYYGMRSILVVFMTEYLMGAGGQRDLMSAAEARAWYHDFATAVYLLPIAGAIISDGFWGKYKTILRLSLVYCVGHLVLALDETRTGLALIAVGSGGIKPCVSANVGDQFGEKNAHLISRVFSLFYIAINFGSFFATLLIPYLLKVAGPSVAFGLPGALMFLATFVFWLGRRKFVHVPPAGMEFVRESFSRIGLQSIGKLVVLMLFLAPFYALFDQTGSAWVLQARAMDLNFLGLELLPSQVGAVNPIMVMILAPAFAYGVYPFVARFTAVTPLRKIGLGFFVTGASFLVAAYIEHRIAQGARPSVWWQMLGYLVITVGEVLTTITALEFFYTQAPTRMKSAIMSVKMFAVSIGNQFTALVNRIIERDDGSARLDGPSYYLFFVGLMFTSAILFVFVARWYPVRDYIQGADSDAD